METSETTKIIDDFVLCAKNAMAAGFDGVELYGAHGHLIHQFLVDGVDDQTDQYGGTDRCRFALESVDAVARAICPDRVGIRPTPFSDYCDCLHSDPVTTGIYMVEQLGKRSNLYAHYVEPRMKIKKENESQETHSDKPCRHRRLSWLQDAKTGKKEWEPFEVGKADSFCFHTPRSRSLQE
ncbi:hypothetical protein Mapa_004869 [Marchantia paleacea]|nr:hypothetical protein Mapa_004869 [Marchantia paleacea]